MWLQKCSVIVKLLGVLLAVAVEPSSGYSGGAPDSACSDLTPSHGVAAQTSPSLYTITFNPANFAPGGGSPVTVTLNAPAGTPGFKGFLLTTQYEGTGVDQTAKPGTFSSLPSNAQLACSNKAVTHTDGNVKQSLSVQWIPPATSGGNVRFRATFVQHKNTFWVDVKASNLLMEDSAAPSAAPSATPSTAPQATTSASTSVGKFPKDAECGKTKGCFSDCDAANTCNFQLTWTQGTAADNVAISLSFVLANEAGRYIAFGLSYDNTMGNDSVTYCINEDNGVFNSFNPAGSKFSRQLADPKDGLADISVNYTSGVLSCSFTRAKAVDSSGERFALDAPYTLFFATGPGSASGASKHDVAPSISPQMASLADFTADVGVGTGQTGTQGPPPSTTPAAPQARKVTSDPDCGTSKGCYSDCDDDGCTFLITWAPGTSDDNVAVTFSAAMDDATGKYIALGLSEDDKMGDDSVVYCIDAASGAFLSYNVAGGKFSRLLTNSKDGLSNIDTKYENGVLSCSFNRVKAADSSGERFALDKPYTLFYASGPGSAAGLQVHTKTPLISNQAASLVDFTVNIGGSADFPLIKAHGSLMIVAWIFAASIGIIFARYFKDVWQNSTWCSQKVWFQIHRTCMVLAFTATVIAFIIIFVEVGGYSKIEGEAYKKAHPILGIIVTALTVINPTMALFRPHPNTPKRPIFNWAHWLVGSAAHILGVITIFFGTLLSKSGAPRYIIYILAAYVGWQVLIQLLLELAQCMGRNGSRSNAYEMTDMNGESSKPPQQEESSFNKRLLVFLHIMVITGFTVALIVVLNLDKES